MKHLRLIQFGGAVALLLATLTIAGTCAQATSKVVELPVARMLAEPTMFQAGMKLQFGSSVVGGHWNLIITNVEGNVVDGLASFDSSRSFERDLIPAECPFRVTGTVSPTAATFKVSRLPAAERSMTRWNVRAAFEHGRWKFRIARGEAAPDSELHLTRVSRLAVADVLARERQTIDRCSKAAEEWAVHFEEIERIRKRGLNLMATSFREDGHVELAWSDFRIEPDLTAKDKVCTVDLGHQELFAELKGFPTIGKIAINKTRPTTWEYLRPLKHIRILGVNDPQSGLGSLADGTSIEFLQLFEAKPEIVHEITKFKSLRALLIQFSSSDSAKIASALDELTKLPQLRHLSVWCPKIEGSGVLASVGRISTLETLFLSGFTADKDSIRHINSLKHLKRLRLGMPGGVVPLLTNESLKELDLIVNGMTEADLEYWNVPVSLETLTLEGYWVPGMPIEYVRRLKYMSQEERKCLAIVRLLPTMWDDYIAGKRDAATIARWAKTICAVADESPERVAKLTQMLVDAIASPQDLSKVAATIGEGAVLVADKHVRSGKMRIEDAAKVQREVHMYTGNWLPTLLVELTDGEIALAQRQRANWQGFVEVIANDPLFNPNSPTPPVPRPSTEESDPYPQPRTDFEFVDAIRTQVDRDMNRIIYKDQERERAMQRQERERYFNVR